MDDHLYRQPADWYDRIYVGMNKQYGAEAAIVDGIARARCPGATSLLDVGCGTGLHLECFSELFETVAGIDLAPSFVTRARKRCPGSTINAADMRSFDLGRRFDVVTCLFSAIGHAGEFDDLQRAVETMAQHVAPDGVLIIEPWLAPSVLREGHFGVEISEAPDSTLIRANHTRSQGAVSVVSFAWTEVTPAGITRVDEELRLTRFSQDEFAAAFERAGMDATFDLHGCNDGGRGLWIAQPAA